MALPIVVALAGIAVGLPIIGLLTHVYPLQSFSTTLATMIGIGVGIDYALFVVTRYRQGLQAGLDPEEAVDHRGRHVRARGAVRGPHRDHRVARHAGDRPVVHQRARHRRGRGRRGHGRRRPSRCCPRCSASSATTSTSSGCRGCTTTATAPARRSGTAGAASCSATPWVLTIAGLAIVLALALPVLSLRLGFVDAGNDPAGTQTRAGLRPRSPRASGPASTARSCSRSRCRPAATTPPSSPSCSTRSRRRRASRRCRPRSRTRRARPR